MGILDQIQQKQNKQSVLPIERKSYLSRLVDSYKGVTARDVAREIPGTIKSFASATRRFLLPTKREVLSDLEQQAGQSLLYTPELRQKVDERLGGFTPPVREGETLEQFLNKPAIGLPDFAGITKRVGTKVVQKSLDTLSDVVENSLKNSKTGIKDKTLDFLRKNPDEITKGEVRLREIEDGRIVIEDGRHRLQAGLEKGIKPNIVDVTQEYTGQPSRSVRDLIERTNAVDEVVNPKQFEVNDRIRLTDKTTGKSQERTVTRVGDGFLNVKDDVSGIPYRAQKDKFDIELVKKGEVTQPQYKIGDEFTDVDGQKIKVEKVLDGNKYVIRDKEGLPITVTEKTLDNTTPVNKTEILKLQKVITPIDTAIAEGKVRVVSRDGRDVYQIRQGENWVNKRDESSALKSLVPKEKIVSPDLPERLQERVINLEIQKEALDSNPAKTLQKYMATRGEFKGLIGEATGKKARSKTGQQFDEKAMDLGYQDSEEARRAFSEYKAKKADIDAEEADVKMAIKQAKLEAKAQQGESKAISELVEPEYTKLPTTPEAIQTLEETADRLKEAMPLSPGQSSTVKPLSLQEIITQTPLKAKVNLVDYFRTPDRVLKKIGFEKEANMLRDGYDKYIVELPKNIDKITKWYEKAPKGSGERIFKYLDGEDIKLVPEEVRLAGEIRTYLKDWADRLNLPEDKRITNYITHIFDEELIAKEFDEDLAKLITDKVPGQVYDPFLEKRLGAKGYKQDVWQALDAYTKRATRKANMDEALSAMQDKAGSSLEYSNLEKSQFDYIQKYISRVNMRPTEIDNLLDTTFKQVFGYGMGQRPVNRITSFMRRLTYRGMLGANIGSALRNLSQTANTYAVLGERDTINGVMKLFSATNRKELEAQGIFANNFIQDRSINATRKLVEKADKGLWLLFDTAEKINRGTAYLGAKTKALRQGKSEQEAIDYAKSIVRKTQFNYDPIDAPVALSSDLVKTLLQFQTYTTKQAEFLIELAKDRDFAALARYSLGGLAFVYTIGQAFGMEPEELLPINTNTWTRFELAPSLKTPKEILKALINVPDDYGNERDVDKKIKDVLDSMWGLIPGGTQLKKSIRGVEAIQDNGSYDKAGRKQFDVGGTTASDIQAILFGKYANKEAKQYFNNETGDAKLDELSKADAETKSAERKRLEKEFNTIKSLPKELQKKRLIELAKENPKFAEKLIDKFTEDTLGLSATEKKLKNQSVSVRAGYIKSQMDGMSNAEKKQLLIEYAKKGILTEDVLDEILK